MGIKFSPGCECCFNEYLLVLGPLFGPGSLFGNCLLNLNGVSIGTSINILNKSVYGTNKDLVNDSINNVFNPNNAGLPLLFTSNLYSDFAQNFKDNLILPGKNVVKLTPDNTLSGVIFLYYISGQLGNWTILQVGNIQGLPSIFHFTVKDDGTFFDLSVGP